jgi:alpha-N-arabinofuranosidase
MGQSAMDFEEKIRTTAAVIEAVRTMNGFRNPIYISFDEWGTFGRDYLSVLPVAQCLNSFIRHADVVKMSNFTMLTSLLSSDKEKGSFKSPLFHIYKLFSTNCRGNSIDTYVKCDTFNTEKNKDIPFLDVTTVYSKEANAVYINVVNRHKDKAITADIINNSGILKGRAEVNLVAGESLNEPFTYDKREQYKPVAKEIQIEGNHISCSFPAHSFTQIKVGVEK